VAKALEKAAEATTVLLVEQNLGVVRRLAQQVVVLDVGRVVHTGPAAAFLDDGELVHRYLGVSGAAE
jgi:branched-chain amino acid transport system ATP-binding protein